MCVCKVYGMIVYIWNMRSGFQTLLMARADVVCVGFWMSFFFLFLTFFASLFVCQLITLFLLFSPWFFPLLSIILLLCRGGTVVFMKAFNVLCNYSWLRLPSLVTSIKDLIITRENEARNKFTDMTLDQCVAGVRCLTCYCGVNKPQYSRG